MCVTVQCVHSKKTLPVIKSYSYGEFQRCVLLFWCEQRIRLTLWLNGNCLTRCGLWRSGLDIMEKDQTVIHQQCPALTQLLQQWCWHLIPLRPPVLMPMLMTVSLHPNQPGENWEMHFTFTFGRFLYSSVTFSGQENGWRIPRVSSGWAGLCGVWC